MEEIKINIFVNQLGNLKMRWIIPSNLVINKSKIRIQVPSFKFDLPKIINLPVPFSSKAIKIEIQNIKIENEKNHISYSLYEDFEGNNFIELIIDSSKKENFNRDIILSYELKNIVNNDTIYYIFVYPLINPFPNESKFNIGVKARFSYKIRKYKFREWYFNSKTGERLNFKKVFITQKTGDLISLTSKEVILAQNVELDIHLTGSRFPIMIRRDIFWLIVFLISLGIILSPIWTAFI